MKQFTLSLAANQQKPVIKLGSMDVLLDTGADFPVWVADRKILINMFDAKFVKKDVPITGFGGNAKGDLYRIDYFALGGLIYAGLDVVVCTGFKNASFYMILSATMFRNLIYQIDDKNHRLNIDIPEGENPVRNLVIADSKGRMHVLCNSVPDEQVMRMRM